MKTKYSANTAGAPGPDQAAAASKAQTSVGRWTRFVPGLAACAVAAAAALSAARLLPGFSPLLIAILLGVTWRNLAGVPASWTAGVQVSSKKLLRTGIVLLGLQLSLSEILGLGAGALLVVVAAVGVTFATTLWIGRALGIGPAQRLLIASGFSICGAAAVAATESATDAEEQETVTAIGLVVLFGTLMIPLVPFLGTLLGLPPEALGMWIGASTHEVAQVVAAGGAVGSAALAVAVTVKLARVLMLAPIIAGVGWYRRRTQTGTTAGKRPPVIPLFVLGFIAAMLLRTWGFLPDPFLETAKWFQTALLTAAMFGLGLGVHFRGLATVGGKPVVLALTSTLTILAVSLGGTLIFPPVS
ncbi:putative sulfate exporter family transporter [Arthrobacter sp. I2-34]|uniref:Sulfate exporter family transporter n=1 Tax=Arthrobacter hankyongi TaxID=2904801 RepID=A0ABS9L9H2_9MICC|nr:putative sulfate exporter family transporter [Arthrobacter hankyongi]MCG2623122.1 putative sulfate exporter family transporter [Arthrobacter hankyongi]